MPKPPAENTRVVTSESASIALDAALSFLFRSQVGPILASIRAEKPLEIPRGWSVGQPKIRNGRIVPFTFWVNTTDEDLVDLLVNGLLGIYFDGIWTGGYVFDAPFIDPGPFLSQARHTSLDERMRFELKNRWLRQTKKRKSGVWQSRIQVHKDGHVDLPFRGADTRRVPVR
jgi:hypothetical protein